MGKTTNRNAIQLAVFIAFGFLFGYDIGVISGCLIMPNFIRTFGELGADGEYFLSSSRQSIITSLLSAGTFVGAIAQAFTSDRFGRRSSILGWSATFTIGVVIQTATISSVVQITVGRFIAGLGVGALSAIVPLYNGETAPKALRGTLLVLYQLQVIVGLFISYVFDLGTHHLSGSASWYGESPRHLIASGRRAEAIEVVATLNGISKDDPLVQELVDELQYSITAENEGGKATWAECFSTRNALWKRTINGMMLQFIQQLNGQNFYYYYGDTFFKSAGTNLSPYVIQVILGAVSVIGTIPALYLIEKWGSPPSVAEATCALIAALVAHYMLAPAGSPSGELTPRQKQGGDVLITFAVLHVFSFAVFWGPTPWVYLGESFPLRIRAKSIALGSATNWLWNFLLSFFSPRIVHKIGPMILLVFFGVLAFGYFYVFFFIPETKGLSLEEVDELYTAKVVPWKSSTWQPCSRSNESNENVDVHLEDRKGDESSSSSSDHSLGRPPYV
ncbi:general substrate transporter [Ephemerocybe angulata]|uniref:General substrate transporter n=1 Tax=Ephemerocybe angulata TaxID=980116 RepID=A0A8H6M7Q7_9AGAR|nr:general substrate transporter [Tulosesus angulatus]